MAEAIESMSTTELRQEVAKGRAQKQRSRAEGKAASMQLAEKGTAVTLAVGVGFLEAWKPELASGLGGVGYLNPALTVLGGIGFVALKGTAKEAASGTLLAGAVPLLNRLGGKLAELTAG